MGAFQDSFFAQLKAKQRKKRRNGKKIPLSEVVSELLDVSRNTAYRKIRGEINVSVNEMEILTNHFNADLNKAAYKTNTHDLFVKRVPNISNIKSLEQYLEQLNIQLTNLSQRGTGDIYIAARDLPFFHAFQQEELSSFKLSVWLRSFTMTNENQGALPNIPRTLTEAAKDVSNVYFSLPVTEIWNYETISNTIQQVQYFRSAGFINMQRAQRILEDLQWVLRSFKRRASRREASPDLVKGDLYHCDYSMFNNVALSNSGGKKIAYIGVSDLRFMETDDPAVTNDVLQSFKRHLQMGKLISGSAEKDREAFFNAHFLQVEKAVDNLK